ncbi:MAG: hypothetical protein LBK99_15810 [Opitutaceae bacterium]|jgi:hypothetical protein|nr:hypothetical protein [Opitutaceae bacterium]
MKKVILLWILLNVILCGVLAAVAGLRHARLATLRTSAASRATATLAQRLETRLRQIEQDLHDATVEFTAMQQEIQNPGNTTPNFSDLSAAERLEQSSDMLYRNPAYLPYQYRSWRRHAQKHFGDFLASTSLSPSGIERFKELVVASNIALNDAYQVALNSGLDSSDPTTREAMEKAAEENRKKIRELLGDDGYRGYLRANNMPEAPLRVRNLQLALADQGKPVLAPEQARRLTEIYEKAGRHSWSEKDQGEIACILTPGQFQVLAESEQAAAAEQAMRTEVQEKLAAVRDDGANAP